MSRRYHVIVNTRSGTALGMAISPEAVRGYFGEAAGDRVTIDADADAPLTERIERARRSDAEVIVAAGGDGTATAVASAILDTDKTLAVMPLGTANTLARDLGVPLDLTQWGAAIDAMVPRRIDVGEVNGRIFLHNVVVGVIPGLVAGREHIRGRGQLSATLPFLRFVFRRLFRARRMAVEITDVAGQRSIRRVVALAVGNNEYDEALGRFLARTRLDGGHLALYLLKRLTVLDLGRLVTEMLLGKWRQDEALDLQLVQALTVRTRKPTVKLMLDGELELMEVPLAFKIRPLALSVLGAPPVEPASPAGIAIPVAS